MANFKVPHPRMQNFKVVLLFIVIFGVFALSMQVIMLITDWLWFQEVGYQNIFYITLITKLKMAALFGIVFLIIFYLNLFLAMRISSPIVVFDAGGTVQAPPWEIESKRLHVLVLAASIFLALFAASYGTGQWENFLLITNSTSFGISDPLFHKDISFYIFSLPFLTHVYSWLMFTIIFTVIATGFIYLTRRSFRFIPPRTWQVAPRARMHLAILVAVLFLWGTFGVWLELNDLLFTKRGVVFG
ncbi:MAG: UPF0182 family protein, partial [Syntrophales bacterium]